MDLFRRHEMGGKEMDFRILKRYMSFLFVWIERAECMSQDAVSDSKYK